jgi:hypothetical protein
MINEQQYPVFPGCSTILPATCVLPSPVHVSGIRSCLQKHRGPFNYISYQANRCSPAGVPLSFDSQGICGLTTDEDLI